MIVDKIVVSLLSVLPSSLNPVAPVTYYVDYVAGNDAADGKTPTTPWRHAVGDPAATLRPAATTLQAGDIVRFKGGVMYRGTINVRFSGVSGKPITYSGTGYGTGAAIIEGADPVISSTPCPSAAACGGAPAWQKLNLVSFNPNGTAFVKFYANDGMLYESQYPAPPDRFFSDDINYFAVSPLGDKAMIESGRLRDPALVALLGGVPGGTLQIWTVGNLVVRREVTGIDGDHVLFNPAGITLYGDRPGRYALTGAARAISDIGQYTVISPGRAVVWPRPAGGLVVGSGRSGFNVNGQTDVTISGFVFRHQTASSTGTAEGAPITTYGVAGSRVTIENNRFEDSSLWDGKGVITISNMATVRIQGNTIRRIERGSGIRVGSGAKDVNVTNNNFERIGRTGIAYLGVTTGTISGNIMTNMTGVHGNGLSLYLNNRAIRVINNRILSSERPMTFHGDKGTVAPGDHNFLIERNIFTTTATAVAALTSWGSNTRGVTIRNNVLIGPKAGVFTHVSDTKVSITRNYLSGILHNKVPGTGWTIASNVTALPSVGYIANDPFNNAKLCTGASIAPGTLLGGITC
jgi:Right handed beta helix region